jgi:hypothetical protein
MADAAEVNAMKLDETMRMAYPRKYLEHIIIGSEELLARGAGGVVTAVP